MTDFSFQNRYINLGKDFYEICSPTPVEKPELIKFNKDLGKSLGLPEDLDEDYLADIFSGNLIHPTSQSLAMVYAGHQFGHFNPQLGDGRAIYLGELVTNEGQSFDIQLKGSGQTCYSRNGDGRAALGPVLREYLLSEAMVNLGVPTTRALAAVSTGEPVARERLLPGGIITRAASSFIRVGSFQYFAMQDDYQSVKTLADYVITKNYPEASSAANPYLALLEAVISRQASLIAKWMSYGFIHGVMNTDNMSIAGETIDYGPCAFIDYYDHNQVYSSIDRQGRYSYSNQPSIGLWNLTRFAETLLPFFNDESDKAVLIAQSALKKYIHLYEEAWLAVMRAKCGLSRHSDVAPEEDKALIDELLDCMSKSKADYTLTFLFLTDLNLDINADTSQLSNLFSMPDEINHWLAKWYQRLQLETLDKTERLKIMRETNPVYIPRNHQVEAVIRAAEDHNDFKPFHALCDVLEKPFVRQQGKDQYMVPPQPHEVVHQTFCGT